MIQYRGRETFDEDQGLYVTVATPYLMDLNATNGTFLNGERIEPQRYYQLLEKDAVKFGASTRDTSSWMRTARNKVRVGIETIAIKRIN